jgi:hypothetical protein
MLDGSIVVSTRMNLNNGAIDAETPRGDPNHDFDWGAVM